MKKGSASVVGFGVGFVWGVLSGALYILWWSVGDIFPNMDFITRFKWAWAMLGEVLPVWGYVFFAFVLTLLGVLLPRRWGW